jgi:hypoxanthine-DNA glycosylase
VSLKKAEYFANPSNTFWHIAGKALGFDRSSVPYEDQEASLGVAGYALWDVLSERQGPGSLDSQTVPGSDRPNDIEGLLLAVQTIHRVCINSKATAHFFRRHHRDWLQKPQTWCLGNAPAREVFGKLVPETQGPFKWTLLVMDSTSPANAPSKKDRAAAGIAEGRGVEGIAEYKLLHTPRGRWRECFGEQLPIGTP